MIRNRIASLLRLIGKSRQLHSHHTLLVNMGVKHGERKRSVKLISYLGRLGRFKRKESNSTVDSAFDDEEISIVETFADAPIDVVSHFMLFAGPQGAQTLSKVNRKWRDHLENEDIWRVLCKSFYKVSFTRVNRDGQLTMPIA